jgi:Bacteriocin-protection, YdeI or OmpD-Associated/Domain of unknown function (DUF1905)
VARGSCRISAGQAILAALAAQRFEAKLEATQGGGAVVVVPFDVQEAFGSKRPPVRATVNGHSFRTTIAPMGGRSLLGLNRDVRDGAGVTVGETVSVELEPDDEPRVVEVPSDFAALLAENPGARAPFNALSYTHRKEYVRWITDAKRDKTRQGRLRRSIEMLQQGTKTPL